MGTLGILTCEILELKFAALLANDKDVARVTILEDAHSASLIDAFKTRETSNLQLIPQIARFTSDPTAEVEVLVQVLELALHKRMKTLQEGLVEAANAMSPYVDALFLGYGLCGNALARPDDLLAETRIPIFIPMDEDHPVDDCIGLLIGGRNSYYGEQCKVAGTFFMIPGWTKHWRRIFDQDFGNLSIDMAKRLFTNYERSLLIETPIMSTNQMRNNVAEFNELFGFREEIKTGTLNILNDTWQTAKTCLRKAN